MQTWSWAVSLCCVFGVNSAKVSKKPYNYLYIHFATCTGVRWRLGQSVVHKIQRGQTKKRTHLLYAVTVTTHGERERERERERARRAATTRWPRNDANAWKLSRAVVCCGVCVEWCRRRLRGVSVGSGHVLRRDWRFESLAAWILAVSYAASTNSWRRLHWMGMTGILRGWKQNVVGLSRDENEMQKRNLFL